MQAPFPLDEAERLNALRQYDVLDTAPEQKFDDLTHLAAQICGTPVSLLCLVDQERQWFKSRVGLEGVETPRDVSFCAHAILGPDLLFVPDATADERFADNSLVTGEPHIRFYAGAPLVTPQGQALGTLCVIDMVPRHLDPAQQDALRRLGRQAGALLETRLDAKSRREAEEKLKDSEMRYRRLFEAAKDGILILDAETGKIEDVNPYLCHLLGYVPDDFVGKQLWEIGTFRDIVANQDAFRTLQANEYIRYDDLPLETKDGHSVSVEFVSNVYACAEKQVIQCNIRDISERKRAVQTEQEAQRFLQSTLDALSSHIAVLDENGKIIAVNAAWRQFSKENEGTAVSCGVGANYLEVCEAATGDWAEEAPLIAHGIREVMAARHHDFCLEYACNSPKEERWFNVCVTRFGDEGPVRVAVAHENITNRKQAESLTRTSEANLAVAQQIAHLGSWELDLSNLKVVNTNPLRWSDEVFRIFGYRPGQIEVSNENFFRAVHPDDRERIETAITQAVREGKAYRLDHRILLPDGGERIVHEQAEVVCDERTGKPLKMVGTVQDITERKQFEQALEARTREIITTWESMTDAFFSLDNQWRFTHINPQAAHLWHKNAEELLGKNIWDEFPGAVGLKFYTEYHRASADQVVVNFEEFYPPDNAWRQVHVYPSPVGLSVYFRDITERKQSEAAMRWSEIRYRSLVEATSAIVWQTPASGEFESEQPGWSAFTGQTWEELKGWGWLNAIHPEDQAETARVWSAAVANRTSYEVEHRLRHHNGQYHHMTVRGVPVLGEDGAIQEWIGIHTDISEAKQADAALRASEERFRAFMDNTPTQVFMKDRAGRYVYLNKAVEQLWRKPASELLGKTVHDSLPFEIAEPLHRSDLQVFANGQAQQFEEIMASSDGRLHHQVIIKFLLPQVGGEQLLAGVSIDVTEQRQAEQERDRFFTLSLDMLAIIGSDGYIKRLNPAFEATLGYSDAELMAVPFLEFVHPDDHVATLEEMTRLANGLLTLRFENRYRCRDGSYKWLRWMVAPFEDLYYCVAHDITSVKQSELALLGANDELEARVIERTAALEVSNREMYAAKQEADAANHAKSEFLSRMSHELRTPMNAILGFGQILEKQELSPLGKESISYILKGGRHLLGLINEVLDIARVEAGHLEISLEPIALNDVVPEVCALVGPLAAARNIHFHENVGELCDNHVLADRQRLKQVLLNLFSNAIKYNREGGQVAVSCGQNPDGWTSISVRDTGPGISPDDLLKLFTPFERLHAAASEIEGTGLGLVLAQRLVKAMGGTLSVESVLGQGTTFSIKLTQATSAEKQLASMPHQVHTAVLAQRSERTCSVLCIEDNSSNIRLFEVIFEGRPEITFLIAMEGGRGLDMARQHEPDLILLDLDLPDMHGKEVLARLQQSALTRDIPVVVISADASPNQVEHLLTAGARKCLTKPLDIDQFLHTLDTFLQVTAAVATQHNYDEASVK